MHFDDILELLGDFGTYQKRVFALLCLPKIIVAFHMLVMAFIGSSPLHRCLLSNWSNDTYTIQGTRHAMLINLSIPLSSDTALRYEECASYATQVQPNVQDTNNQTIHRANVTSACTAWVYDETDFQNTLVTELNLVCDDKLMKSHAQSVFFAGLLVGAIGFGVLADVIGRKKVYMLTIVLNTASGVAAAFAPEYYSFILVRMLNGATNAGLMGNSFVIGIELVGPKKRVWAAVVIMYFFTVGLVVLAGIAYLIRDWRHLEIAISAPMAIFIIYWWLIPESPRWLLAKGRIQEAGEIIQHAARVNKVVLPDKMFKKLATLETEPSAKQHINFSDIYRSKTMLARSSVMLLNWFVANIAYYGIMLNMGRLSGSRYLNFFLGGLVEFPSYTMLLLLLDRLGRKPLHIFSILLSGVACLSTIFPIIYAPSIKWIMIVLALIGKFGATAAFCLVYVLTTEMFPTVMRNGVLGVGSLSARLGGIVAPYIVVLGEYVGGIWGQALPLIIMGGAAVICGLLALHVFPETLGEKLPETLQDSIDLGKKRNRLKYNNPDTLIKPDSLNGNSDHARRHIYERVAYDTRL